MKRHVYALLCAALLMAVVFALPVDARAQEKADQATPFLAVEPAVKADWGLTGNVVCAFFDEAYSPLARQTVLAAQNGTSNANDAGNAGNTGEAGGAIGVALCVQGDVVQELGLYLQKRPGGTGVQARPVNKQVKPGALFTIINRAMPISREEADDRSGLMALKGKWYQRSGKGVQYIEPAVVAPLEEMLLAAKGDGCKGIYISSSYRDYAYQKKLFDDSVRRDMKKGMNYDEAYEATATRTAVPGSSEHHKGFTLDLLERGSSMGASFAKTRLGKWLAQHAVEYGFTIRYGADKTAQTRIIYEPWHVRYVGRPAAYLLAEKDWCMEEFLAQLKKGGAIAYSGAGGSGYFFYRRAADVKGERVTCSPAGDGGYIVALQLG